MNTRLNGLGMVAVGLASLAMLPACGMGEDEYDGIGGVPVQDHTVEFDAPQNVTTSDASKACTPGRADHVDTVEIGGGSWGSYSQCISFCPAGSYALQVATKSEASQGGGIFGGDDTALNGVRLGCIDLRTGAFTGNITSLTGKWGSWSGTKNVDPFISGNPFDTGRMNIEGPQGPGDDTAANAIELTAKSGKVARPGGQHQWGTWDVFTHSCKIGTAICGINTRVEGSLGAGDDTALNGVTFACCTFAP